MQAVTTIGVDIAKSVFQVHGVDAASPVLIRRQLKRVFRSCPNSRHRPSSAGTTATFARNELFAFWTRLGHQSIT